MLSTENSTFFEKKNRQKNLIKSKPTQDQTVEKNTSKVSFKNIFIQWLSKMPLQERYLAAKVRAPWLAKEIQDCLIDIQNSQTQLVKSEAALNKKIHIKNSKQIIDAIILISDGLQFFDNIGFDFTYVQYPEKLFDLLTLSLSLSEKQIYINGKIQIKQVSSQQTKQLIRKSTTKQEMTFYLIQFLRSQIFIKCQQRKSINVDEEKNRKKEFNIFWRNISQHTRQKILLLQHQDAKELLIELQSQKINLSLSEIIKQIQFLMKLDMHQFCNKIFKAKLKKSLTYITDYHQLIYKQWKNQIAKRKRRNRNIKNSNNQKFSAQNLVQPKSAKMQLPSKKSNRLQKQQEKSQCKPKKKRNRVRRKKSFSAQSHDTKATDYKINQCQKQQKIQYESIKSQSNPQENTKLEIPIQTVNFEKQVLKKCSKDILDFGDQLNAQANQFHQRRIIAYERLQFMLSIWGIPIKLFGSCASGITIKNSDIDVAVDNSILNYFQMVPQSQKLKVALQGLQKHFKTQPWVTEMKVIKTASIPIIKMKVDTSIQIHQIPGMAIFPQYFQNLNRDHSMSGQTQVDMTIQTINKDQLSSHLGIISTNQINKWLQQMPYLTTIIVILKNYLTRSRLNVTYEGGLNTYCLIVMIVAFIKHHKLEKQTDIAIVFKKLSHFYAYQFQEKLTGIDLDDPISIFYDKINFNLTKSDTTFKQSQTPNLITNKSAVYSQADLEIKDPLNNGKIMTKNCYSFPKIKGVFQIIYEQCFHKNQQTFEEIFKEKYPKKWANSQNSVENQQILVNQVLLECHQQLKNPFFTLFE